MRKLAWTVVSCATYSILMGLLYYSPTTSFAQQRATCKDSQASKVIRYERRSVGPTTQAYGIEICDDGTVTYIGIENVKTLGVVQFAISPQVVDTLFISLWKIDTSRWYGRDSIPRLQRPVVCASSRQNQTCDPNQEIDVSDNVTLELVLPKRSRKLVTGDFPGINLIVEMQFRGQIEASAPTRQYRCPFLARLGFNPLPSVVRDIELCEYEEEIDQSLRQTQLRLQKEPQ